MRGEESGREGTRKRREGSEEQSGDDHGSRCLQVQVQVGGRKGKAANCESRAAVAPRPRAPASNAAATRRPAMTLRVLCPAPEPRHPSARRSPYTDSSNQTLLHSTTTHPPASCLLHNPPVPFLPLPILFLLPLLASFLHLRRDPISPALALDSSPSAAPRRACYYGYPQSVHQRSHHLPELPICSFRSSSFGFRRQFSHLRTMGCLLCLCSPGQCFSGRHRKGERLEGPEHWR